MTKVLRKIWHMWKHMPSKFVCEISILRDFWYDYRRFSKYSRANKNCTRRHKEVSIIIGYHVLEKGITMPNRHLGFGHDAVLWLIHLLREYAAGYGVADETFIHAVATLRAYRDIHHTSGFQLDDALLKEMNAFLGTYPEIAADPQISMTKETYFSHLSAPFPEFARSRRSVRHYCGEVPIEKILRAVETARCAPSACNRQPARVHCYSDKQKIRDILALQRGNRGFGDSADKLLVITADLQTLCSDYERLDLNTNAGMFIMNLCYALHYEKIAHCILNWSVTPSADKKLRKKADIPDYENIVCLIACGDCPDEFMLVSSPRKETSSYLSIHS